MNKKLLLIPKEFFNEFKNHKPNFLRDICGLSLSNKSELLKQAREENNKPLIRKLLELENDTSRQSKSR